MAEDLETVMRKVSLSGTELDGADLCKDDVTKGLFGCKNILIGNMIGDKRVNFAGIRNFSKAFPRTFRNDSPISHLFYADDAIIFCKATGEEATRMMSILNRYESAFGQLVNLDQSSVFLSKNTSQNC
ncbi:hypothetical protein ACH5RR_040657 [Cinchona calisaya]|uniref:Reverse transcriptase n=1 Tax=Cinchona calisaya TaxID=153742 RepID=A0ABD2XVE6_9GENT